ncbi:TPA: hypothetical protein EYP38_02395 [Candidatus Micrarchaeota archaeon]|nr:hypothetical protein [Candidatus Micrarchaeota archaeon]
MDLLATPDFGRDYRLYRAMRLSIAGRLSNVIAGKQSNGGKPKQVGASHLDEEARRELDEVVKSFAELIAPNYGMATVLKVKEVKKKKEKEAAERNKERLKRGVVTEKPEELDMEVIETEELHVRAAILQDFMDNIAVTFRSKKSFEGKEILMDEDLEEEQENIWITSYMREYFGYETHCDILKRSVERAKKRGMDLTPFMDAELEPGLLERRRKNAREFYDWIMGGEADKAFGVEDGTCIEIAKIYIRHVSITAAGIGYNIMLNEAYTWLQEQKLAGRHYPGLLGRVIDEIRRTAPEKEKEAIMTTRKCISKWLH